MAANGVPAEDLRPPPDIAWTLQSDRGVTYSDRIPAGSRVVAGDWWKPGDHGPALVSFEKRVADAGEFPVHDSGEFPVVWPVEDVAEVIISVDEPRMHPGGPVRLQPGADRLDVGQRGMARPVRVGGIAVELRSPARRLALQPVVNGLWVPAFDNRDWPGESSGLERAAVLVEPGAGAAKPAGDGRRVKELSHDAPMCSSGCYWIRADEKEIILRALGYKSGEMSIWEGSGLARQTVDASKFNRGAEPAD